jgi:hypothetical protein
MKEPVLYKTVTCAGSGNFYPGYSKAYPLKIVTRDLVNKFASLYEKNKGNTLKPGSKVCLAFNALPLYKLKLYFKENKISKVRDFEQADSIIVNAKLIKDYYNITNNHSFDTKYRILTADLIEKIDLNFSNYLLRYKEDKNCQFVCEEQQLKSNLKTHVLDIESLPSFKGTLLTNQWGNTQACSKFDIFEKLVKNHEKYNIVFEEELNKDLNKGLTIDDEVFQNLLNLLKASDPDNIKLAQELVANLDLESAKPYLYFLFWMSDKFRKINNNNNFKFVRDQLNPHKYYHISLESFLGLIVKDKPEYKQTIFSCLAMYINVLENTEVIKEIKVS